MTGMLNAVVASVLLLSSASYAAAQVERASVTGTVKDQSDAVVPGATVTAVNVGTNVPAQAVTDAQGGYVIPALIPGEYVVDVELQGFRKSSKRVQQLKTRNEWPSSRLKLKLDGWRQRLFVACLSPHWRRRVADEVLVPEN